jgi:hypothetical protein
MSSDISYLYQDSKSKTIRGLADDFLSTYKELERTRKALDVAKDGLQRIADAPIGYCMFAEETLEQITATLENQNGNC